MRILKLGNLVTISKGKKANLLTEEKQNTRRYIQIDDLRNDNNIKLTDTQGVLVNKNDLIIAWDGANAGTVGYGISGIIGSTLAKLEIKDGEILPEYLGRFLRSKSKYLRGKSTGATIPHINKQILMNLPVPIPDMENQRRVVKILDQADLLCQKRKQAIRMIDEYIKSVFLEMFGDKAVGNSDWNSVSLMDLAKDGKNSMRTGPFGSDLLHSEFVKSGIAVIGIDNAVKNKFTWDERRFITKEKYEKLKRYTLYPCDVIITIMGTVGRSAVIPDDIPLAINTKHLAAITLDQERANPVFVSYSIHTDARIIDQVNRRGRGAIMTGLNLGIIKQLQFKLPPIELQNSFALRVKDAEVIKQNMLKQSRELENLFQALMQKAFRGDL